MRNKKRILRKGFLVFLCLTILGVCCLGHVIILNRKYNKAIEATNERKDGEARKSDKEIRESQERSEINAKTEQEEYETKELSEAQVGDTVVFGSYEQDGDLTNGKEDIEWLVLEVKDGKILVISRYVIACQLYHDIYTEITWENCVLREWLNNEFIKDAFDENERGRIPKVMVSADENPVYDTKPGNDTEDQVFVLSVDEVNKYFESDSARQCRPTPYTVDESAYSKREITTIYTENTGCPWWLRTPGNNQKAVSIVDMEGHVSVEGFGGNYGMDTVRPALWIKQEQ